jgi:serine/threonine-protein kinase
VADVLERLKAALSDRYRIERELGSGGMATVYLAHDLKHDRQVALKVMRPELSAILGGERFLREVSTAAKLNHPHILALHDSGEAEEFLYYVMPYVEGESLRAKLNREKQLSVDEATAITKQVGAALDHAHEKGVIHRDIKPENILIHQGEALVADFGIALAVSAAGGTRLTDTGLSLGTPEYMSPEQATGDRELDARSDVYSLGAVTYEMLVGEPPHTGKTVQAIIAKVVSAEAQPVSTVRHSVPGNVDAAVMCALAKTPADRFGTGAEFADAINNPAFTLVTAAGAAATVRVGDQWTALNKSLAALLFVSIAISVWSLTRQSGSGEFSVYDVGLPDTAPMSLTGSTVSFSVSPSGDFVVYRADRDTTAQLWFRSLIDTVMRPIPGTDGAVTPAVSPSGGLVAFTTGRALKTVPARGGPVSTLTQLLNPTTLRWVSDSRLLVNERDGFFFRWIEVESGAEQVEEVPYCQLPQPFPDTDRFLCGGGGSQYARVLNVHDGTYQYVRHGGTARRDTAVYLRGADFRLVEDAYLTYVSLDGDLRAVPFDPTTLDAGRPVALASGVRRQPYSGAGQYSVSESGTLVYVHGANGDVGHLVSREEGEVPTSLPIDPAMFLRFAISPDSRQLAAVVGTAAGDVLRVYDLETGRRHDWLRSETIAKPVWTSSDDLFVSLGTLDLDWAILAGSPSAADPPDTLFSGSGTVGYSLQSYHGLDGIIGVEWSDPPNAVAFDISGGTPRMDTILTGAVFPALSPDGKWLTYQLAGASQILLMPFPAKDRRFQVSGVGLEPQWLSANELAFRDRGGSFYRVTVGDNANRPVGVPRLWFSDPRFSDTPGLSYEVIGDGTLMYMQEPEQKPAAYLRVIPNWVEQMKRAVDEANR